jgi:hypothetical protein
MKALLLSTLLLATTTSFAAEMKGMDEMYKKFLGSHDHVGVSNCKESDARVHIEGICREKLHLHRNGSLIINLNKFTNNMAEPIESEFPPFTQFGARRCSYHAQYLCTVAYKPTSGLDQMRGNWLGKDCSIGQVCSDMRFEINIRYDESYELVIKRNRQELARTKGKFEFPVDPNMENAWVVRSAIGAVEDFGDDNSILLWLKDGAKVMEGGFAHKGGYIPLEWKWN